MRLMKEMNLEMFKLLNRISCSSQFPQVRIIIQPNSLRSYENSQNWDGNSDVWQTICFNVDYSSPSAANLGTAFDESIKYYYFPTLTAVLSKGKNSRLNCSNNSKNKSKANFSSST